MSGSEFWGLAAGHHEPPAPPGGPPPPTNGPGYPQYRPDSTNEPENRAYNPHAGHSVPPGYVPPRDPPPTSYNPESFPPPRREEFRDQNYPPPPQSEYDRSGYGERVPDDHESRAGGYGYDDRPYAPSEPHPNEGNALAPFDEEKAEAEWRRAYDDDQRRRYSRPPPPCSTYNDRYDDERYYDDRDHGYNPRYDPRDSRYDPVPPRVAASPDSYYDYRDRMSDGRRRRDSRYGNRSEPPTKGNNRDIFRAHEGDRGLGAKVLGGAAGALAGHELGHSLLDTIGGAIVGAVGAKVLENQYEKRKLKKEEEAGRAPPSRDSRYDDAGSRYPGSSYADSRAPTRERRPSRSRSGRSRSMGRRSMSRGAPPRSRSRSWSSDDRSPPPSRR